MISHSNVYRLCSSVSTVKFLIPYTPIDVNLFLEKNKIINKGKVVLDITNTVMSIWRRVDSNTAVQWLSHTGQMEYTHRKQIVVLVLEIASVM